MNIDRRSLNVLLASLGLTHLDLAELMGYRAGYVKNVLTGCTPVSGPFRSAFGEVVAGLLLGPDKDPDRYPAAPLRELLSRRAEQSPCKQDFYSDLGLSPQGWNQRAWVSGELVDRVCCALGVHPSAVYPHGNGVEAAS